ncbi:type II toxin-antitoxin system RelE/ParE family toxin [Candidatus Peregrinibacteria bacterium CG10_big_fil_rev_8_21_14_0_10_36_19]|nr:MAG: type II toxin-antitoxin system RelE/ParE family toxin [Candidatus Peregrinibacteria bacterium CG10_big_fil_rev_8_21_14_0_10_36_19]
MNEIEKFLRSLNKKERQIFIIIMEKLQSGVLDLPGIKKLHGKNSSYRLRIGKYRIIFIINSKKEVEFVKIGKRNENLYKNI